MFSLPVNKAIILELPVSLTLVSCLLAISSIPSYSHSLKAEFRKNYITAGEPDNYLVNPPSFFDGVANIFLETESGNSLNCSGSLLGNGGYILTAAHCLTDDLGNLNVMNSAAFFELSSGPEVLFGINFFIHPNWNGQLTRGYDIALIQLEEVAPDFIPRYQLYTNSDEVGQVSDKAGYGAAGRGDKGIEFKDGQLRSGKNRYDTLGDEVLIDSGLIPGVDFLPEALLLYDFDNGLAANDGFGLFYNIHNLGLGADEVNAAEGDSGSPSFIGGKIAGINSFGFNLIRSEDGLTSDIDNVRNSSFGEFSADTRVSLYVDWINQIVSTSEPHYLWGLLSLAFWFYKFRC
jgi:secreted trypsin-like serine protease